MKTDVAKGSTSENSFCKSMEERIIVQGTRKSLHPLQKAAGDKENLVGGGRIGSDMPANKEKLLVTPSVRTTESVCIKKQKTSKTAESKNVVSAEDLTSEEAPSSSYWQRLSETQRVALDAALTENMELRERVKVLEEENEQCKILLEETKALVATLKEMLYDPDEETSGEE